MKDEVWKAVVGFEGRYEVSNHGRVSSLPRVTEGRVRIKQERFLKPTLGNTGYLSVGFCFLGKVYRKNVHRLVAQAFIDNPKGLPEVNHIDEDRKNNSVENLEWVTRQENAIHSIKKFRGSNAGTAVLNEEQVLEIKELLRGGLLTQREIAELFQVSFHTIFKIKAGVNWAWLNSQDDLEEVKR